MTKFEEALMAVKEEISIFNTFNRTDEQANHITLGKDIYDLLYRQMDVIDMVDGRWKHIQPKIFGLTITVDMINRDVIVVGRSRHIREEAE